MRNGTTRAFATAHRDGYNSHMEKATVSKLKDNLSAYLRKVRAGHAVVIYDRDVPIARLERIESSGRGSDRLALLLAQGVTRPPLRALTASKVRAMLPKPIDRSVRLLDALELDRADDR
jgi:antitoxin (DNA-binding transcriptional repressor) of toxin-antitoxin stability system